MTENIKTYDELLLRKRNLENLLHAQKELIRLDIQELKAEIKPMLGAASSLSDFVTRDKRSWLLGIGANKVIDLLVKRVVLAKSGWIAKLVVPFFIKNYSSHFIARHQDEWLKSLLEMMSSNGKGEHEEEHQAKAEE